MRTRRAWWPSAWWRRSTVRSSSTARTCWCEPASGWRSPIVDEADVTADELLRRADVAMFAAKRSRSSQLVTFTAAVDLGRSEDVVPAIAGNDTAHDSGSARLLGELRHAIEHGGLSVVYQPKFDLRTLKVVGLEALIRWPHPRRGLLSPHQFLPLVRQHGLMRSVTEVVLDLALDDAAKWCAKGVGVPMAINVFAPAISDPDLLTQISRALDQRGLHPSVLTVEITEDLLLDNLGKTRPVFNTLRAQGNRGRHRRLRQRLLRVVVPARVSCGRGEARKGVHRADPHASGGRPRSCGP